MKAGRGRASEVRGSKARRGEGGREEWRLSQLKKKADDAENRATSTAHAGFPIESSRRTDEYVLPLCRLNESFCQYSVREEKREGYDQLAAAVSPAFGKLPRRTPWVFFSRSVSIVRAERQTVLTGSSVSQKIPRYQILNF